MLVGVQNDMFIQTFLKRWRPYQDFVRFGGSANYQRRYEEVASITDAESGNIIKVDLVNGDEFEIIKSIKTTICAGVPKVGTGEVVIQFIGDSFTNGDYFKSAILENNYVPKVRCVGLRKVQGYSDQYNEGRGGWTLGSYFSNKVNDHLFFNPFLQTQGKFHYWGSSAFWKNATGISNKTISTETFEPNYSCGKYDCSKFNAKGILRHLEKNDVYYDNDDSTYKKWTGKSWKNMEEDELVWSFQYGKYLEMWDVPAPEFLIIMLGINDFRNCEMPVSFTNWNKQIEIVLNSYRAAVPNGKLAICTPCTSSGTLNNIKGDFTVRQNAAIWNLRKNIIDVFDKRESEGIYVVDASITIDNENGYMESNTELPYQGYQGENRLKIQKGNPHPYACYPNLGIPIAAFIQYYREK